MNVQNGNEMPEEGTPLEGVAIIGMAGRFPGAADLEAFWRNLVEGRDTITRFGAGEVEARNAATGDAEYVAARGVLEDASMFDAEYFGISPREAERMDPQHRIFLETCVAALEDGGYGAGAEDAEIGLFAGCSLNTYLLANLARDRVFLEELTGSYQVGEFPVALGNDKDFLTTRAAYKLNLRGPVVSVQSACATSLVAICQAAQALMSYTCEMALAGGVSVTFPQHRGHVFQDGGIVSSDGHCRPFDAAATGTVFGHGVGVVLLKRLEDAVRDGDHVHAVLRGFAVNNDGSGKAGYMAPGVDGQARVIAAAQAMAGVTPDEITYVEAHGTGTPLGDPIEIAALTQVFRAGTERQGFCAVGTAKGHVGHLDAAAGVTGVMKTALSLQHRMLPGLMHFEKANANIEMAASPFVFRRENTAWSGAGPLKAGVSAFGVGGVNAHVVMAEAPPMEPGGPARERQVLCITGRSEAAALQAAQNLSRWVETHAGVEPGWELADAAYTLARGRRAHGFRLAVVAGSADEARERLRARTKAVKSAGRKVAFLFPGQGAQFVGMGRELYASEPVYREVVDACAAELEELLGLDLRKLMFGDAGDAGTCAQLERTEYAQPAIFVTEVALATLWQSWGVAPEAMLGHSLGECVAATLAGVFKRGEALRLVALRGRLMQAMPAGAMLSVALGEGELAKYVGDEVCVAALNAPQASVLAGTFAAIEAAERRLATDGVATRRLRTSHAFHSAMMEPMLEGFAAEVAKIGPRAPGSPFVSSVTGQWITAAEATDPAYWAAQCRQPVRFADAARRLAEDGFDVLLEAGPGETLTTLAMQGRLGVEAVASVTRGREQRAGKTIQDALAALWSAGVEPDWNAYYAGERRRRVSLPTYPFERTLHWVEPPARVSSTKDLKEERLMSPAALAPLPVEDLIEKSAPERRMRLRAEIAAEFAALSGIETTSEEYEHPFLELGFDSLFLTQATQALSRKFGVKLTFRQLMEQFSSIASLADHLDAVLPAEKFAVVAVVPRNVSGGGTQVSEARSGPPASSASGVEQLLEEQLAALSQMFAGQVEALRAAAAGMGGGPTHRGETAMDGARGTQAHQAQISGAINGTAALVARPAVAAQAEVRFAAGQAKVSHELDAEQGRYIAGLVARYAAKTPGSKRLTAGGRGQLADPRAVAGFRPQWKEMVYPLVTERARGARLWDVDGNEYIDIVNGYGCIMFGHSPEFVVEAAREQLERGVAIGPQTPLAAEVAALICELTGNERVTFCNTGSEAVMAAIRVARTVTGRDKIVYFAGDYHGTFDEVLVRATPRGTAPVAPGIPLANVTNVEVLEYGADASLAWLRAHAEEIAAVLVEPVQTRNPGLQPVEFLRAVREVTEAAGAAMILDEVVTGFRLAPGGAQEFFGIRADMCTYGKVIGGGHPIGVLSGKAAYLDALDGGAWRYGDDSGPEVGVTFFAGTFVRHPLALAAARAVMGHLKAAGPALQRDLNAKTARLAESLDEFFAERGVGCRVRHFASWFYFTFPHEARLASLFYYSMRARGIHIQEGYPCFLTTTHTDADLAEIERAFRETVVEMQEAKALPASTEALAGMRVGARLHADALMETLARVRLTEAQQEIFLAAALNEEANCAFNESLTLTLRGPVREEALAASLSAVFARHDALRSTVSADGEWLEVGEAVAFAAECVDMQGLDSGVQREMLADATEREARTAFDLTQGPLLRATCFRMSAECVELLLTAHHIVLDGWSANQMLEEVGRLYSAGVAAEGKLARLLPFSSYAELERRREAQGEFAENEAYWVAQFAGRSPRLELPTDRPRPREKSYRGSTFAGAVSHEVYAELKKTSARAGCTLYVTLLSGFELLLHRLSGQGEVVVGISTAGQALYEGASLVGHCVHFLPMLSELREGMTAVEHQRATKTALLDAYDHQEFTYGSLLRKLKLDREPGRMPLIEVQFNLEKVGANVVFDGLEVAIAANAKRFVNTDLFLNVMETPAGLEFACDYNTALFDEATLARWMAEWEQMLRSAAAEPEATVDALEVLPPDERTRVLTEWNRTQVEFGLFEPMHASFLRRAEAEPGRTALECGGVAWSYGELAAYAQGLAARLKEEGLASGELVALYLERSPEMVGAMLGVMLAGGAYVPLDPRHPRERLELVLEDAGARLVLAAGALGWKSAAKVLDVSRGVGFGGGRGLADSVRVEADALAYVIYTSGSTGKPKGVAIEHGALVNLLRSMEREPGLGEDDVLVAITTLAFDIAALELLLPLLTGAKLVIATADEVTDGRRLLGLLEETRATVLQGTPGAWRLLMDAGWTGTGETNAPPLKVLCGGEALPRELAERLLDRSGEVWNVYGPTETTIWSSATRVTRGLGPVQVGPPIANTQFYVLDKHCRPVPIGVTGELYIGGAGLARGYWKRPELTTEKFVANPFDGGRMYATGDLARFAADGHVELLGRTDFQVKIRGYRIELGEIESALARHARVAEAVVAQQKTEATGQNRLVAYVATGFQTGDARTEEWRRELRAMLEKTLPEYMIPAAFVVLEKLPRTANGKVDRKALPQAAGLDGSEESRRVFTPPNSPGEKLLAGIWAEVLDLKAVSVTDSIFELGADSLLIFRIAARAQREGLDVNATQIFQQRTVAAVCAALAAKTEAAPVRVTTRISAAAREKYRLTKLETKVEADATIH